MATPVPTSSIHPPTRTFTVSITSPNTTDRRRHSVVHHSQIDRVWWIWQNQDIKNRQNALADTLTFLDSPPSRNGTLNDTMTLGSMLEAQFPNITQGDAMNTLGGPFCYVYA